MDNEYQEILVGIKKIQERFEKEDKWYFIIMRIGEKLLIPLMIALLAFVASHASNRIAESQMELAKKQSEQQLKVKYIEIFYNDLKSDDSNSQEAALRLFDIMDPELAERMAPLAELTPNLSTDLKKRIAEINSEREYFGELINYKIGIYFTETNQDYENQAGIIEQGLKDKGFRGQIKIYSERSKNEDFWKKVNPPQSFEIRYEDEDRRETEAAHLLKDILKEIYPERDFQMSTVGSVTPNFISLFLGP